MRFFMGMIGRKGFTLIEILIVISIIGLMFSVSLPISYSMYMSYKASLKAEEVMVFISGLKRESFLYSEAKVLSTKDGVMVVNGKEKTFGDTSIQIDQPIEFYRNGTTSGGTLKIYVGNQAYSLNVKAPFGDIILERKGS
jgi:prepilin-type N-terminal cleavage/methylation domain-containing protein